MLQFYIELTQMWEKKDALNIVSLHWGWVCEVLTPRQVANLSRFTDIICGWRIGRSSPL